MRGRGGGQQPVPGGKGCSGLALLAEQQQRTVEVKREREEAKSESEDAHENLKYQTLFTDFLQGKIDELIDRSPELLPALYPVPGYLLLVVCKT